MEFVRVLISVITAALVNAGRGGEDTMAFHVRELKPGDEVAIKNGLLGDPDFCLDVVAKITPSGQVVLHSGRRFGPNGYEHVGATVSWMHRGRLCQATPEIRATIHHHNVIRRLNHHLDHWRDLPTETLKTIAAILERHEVANESPS